MSKIKETIPERANFHDDSPEYEPSDSECTRFESLWQKVAKVVNTKPEPEKDRNGLGSEDSWLAKSLFMRGGW